MTEDACLGTFSHLSLSLLVFRDVLPHTSTIKLTRVSKTPYPHTESVEVIWDMSRMSEGAMALARVAEWSKAPDSSSGGRESAWVQIPPRAVVLFIVYPMPKVIIKVFMLRICTSTHLG